MYYLLKMVDTDGGVHYSPIAAVHPIVQYPVRVYPNPAQDYVLVSHPKIKGNERIALVTLSGMEVATVTMTEGAEASHIQLDQIPNGTYYLVYFDGADRQAVQLVVHQ